MGKRKVEFINNEHYHIFNRGVEKREIFLDRWDFMRFLQAMREFNTVNPIGSLYQVSSQRDRFGSKAFPSAQERLVAFICYCLNPNHYHLILKQLRDKGIEKFMQRIGTGHSKYFNHKYKRSGSLFEGKFKAVHIDSNDYLLHLSAYINLNDRVHSLESQAFKSSWKEYVSDNPGLCEKNIILAQFRGPLEYEKFAKDSLEIIREKKEMERLLLE